MARLRKRNYRALTTRTLLILALVGITFLFARGAVRMYSRYREASQGSQAAVALLQSLEARKDTLKRDTDRLSSERGLEEELRRRYGVALPGEGVIEISAANNAATTSIRSSMTRRLLNWLF